MADYPITGGVETLVEVGGTPSAGFSVSADVPPVVDLQWSYRLDAVSQGPVTVNVVFGGGVVTDVTMTGGITTAVDFGWTWLGQISVPFFMTGGITTPVVLRGFEYDPRLKVTVVMGGHPQARFILRGGVTTLVEFGGEVQRSYVLMGGVETVVVLGGKLRDSWDVELLAPVEMGATFTVNASFENPGIDTSVEVFYTKLGVDIPLTGGVETPVVLGGSAVPTSLGISGGITAPVVLDMTSRIAALITQRGIQVLVRVGGTTVAELASQASPEAEAEKTGVRRLMTQIVYVLSARVPFDVSDVPFGRAFTVSSDFSETSGIFYESGAGPNYVGYKLGTESKTYYVFRAPIENEVLWKSPENNLIRYEFDRTRKIRAWKPYKSLPQRALDAVEVFDAFDPDKVYSYYATVVGSMMAQLQRDNAVISTMMDARVCPKTYLSALATSIDAEFDAAEPEATQRLSVLSSVPSSRRRGFSDASVLRMRASGFTSEIFEMWSKMGWPHFITNRTDVSIGTSSPENIISRGYDGSVPSAPYGITYFRNNYVPDPEEWVEVVRGASTKRFYFDTVPSGAPAGSVAVPVSTAPNQGTRSTETKENLVNAVNLWMALTLEQEVFGPPDIAIPHSYNVAEPIGYWVSRFVLIILNHANGDRVVLDELEKQALRTRLDRALPAAARVKNFGTAAPAGSDSIGCSEAFVITQVV